MNNRAFVIVTVAVVAATLAVGGYYLRTSRLAQATAIAQEHSDSLIRSHSPVLGPDDARVTIVEFLDPACEACRAFYPVVKTIMDQYPDDIRLVIRYAPFHDVSEEAIGIIEAARIQGLFETVLEALFVTQPLWAAHGGSNPELAWRVAESVGLDLDQGQSDATSAAIVAIIEQDTADIAELEVRQTPTFYINGEPLATYTFDGLAQMIAQALDSTSDR